MLHIHDAEHGETSPEAETLLISPLACSLSHESEVVHIMAGTLTAVCYNTLKANEQFNCSYGLNPHFRTAIENSTLVVAGVGLNNEVRIIESPQHRFFVATLFQPQLHAFSGSIHPLIQAFVSSIRK